MTPENAMLSAWSNGHWIYLDLNRNRYLGGAVQREAALQEAHFAAVTPLRDLQGDVRTLVPAWDEIQHFGRCAWLAWRHRKARIDTLLAMMREAPRTRRATTNDPAAIAHYALTYQHLRNLRIVRPLCLEDSVGCALFLRRFVEAPTFFIGVKQPPFIAHAWVQVGDVIVNDTKGVVGGYSRILALPL